MKIEVKDIPKLLRGFYTEHLTALNGLLDKAPAAIKAELQALYDSLNAQLAKLPPLEQVPAAQEAGWALNALSDAWAHMQEYTTGILGRLQKMQTEMSAQVTELNALHEQVANGELVAKIKVTELCAAARTEGDAAGRQAVLPDLRALRGQIVALAGLPGAPDAVLELAQAPFEAAVTAAKDNVAKLADKGLKLGGKGDAWVKSIAWASQAEFASQFGLIAEILPAPAPRKDPVVGSPGAAGKLPIGCA